MNTENLSNREAIDKLKEMIDKTDTGMLCPFVSGSDYPHAIPIWISAEKADCIYNVLLF